MRSIKQIKNIKGKIILLRVDFNVPIKSGVVQDNFRIVKAIPSIKFLQNKGAKIILITHLGKGGNTLLPVYNSLNKLIKSSFIPNVVGPVVEKKVKSMKNGDVILLQNLRNNPGEQKCDNVFAKQLAKLADIYVNECFSVDHRKDASIILLPKLLPSYAGFQLVEEVKNLSHAFKNPKRPFLFILGGAKFSTKMPLIKKYLKLADRVFVGGALANDFLKAKGYDVGKSLVDDTNYGIAEFLKNKKLVLPTDFVLKDKAIVDIGRESTKNLATLIKKSKLILWNGPLGKYEDGGAKATEEILKKVAASKAESIIGGGDTVTLISKMKMEKKFSFVSTGGGATLDFLANGTLPGIKALK